MSILGSVPGGRKIRFQGNNLPYRGLTPQARPLKRAPPSATLK